jgi:hypothetical protein
MLLASLDARLIHTPKDDNAYEENKRMTNGMKRPHSINLRAGSQ